MVKLAEGDDMRQLCIEVRNVLAYCINIKEFMNVEVEIDGNPWNHVIKAYIRNGEYLSRAMDSERNHDTILLRCIDAPEANHLMEEMHEGMLGAHASGPLLVQKIMKALLLAHHGK